MTEIEMELEKVRSELETERMRLAGVSVALFDGREEMAIGADNPCYSAAYADALALRRAYDQLLVAMKATGYLMPEALVAAGCRVPGTCHMGPVLEFQVDMPSKYLWGSSCSFPGHRAYVEAALKSGKGDLKIKEKP